MSSDVTLDSLRARLWQLETGLSALAPLPALPLGLPAIDRTLPAGGLVPRALHEILGAPGDGAGIGFAVFLLARSAVRTPVPAPVLWIAPRAAELYGPALPALGLDPGRLVLVEIPGRKDRLWACAEALRTPGLGAVLAEVEGMTLLESRRLQLAAEAGGTLGLLLRTSLEAGGETMAGAGAARSRWRVASLPSRSAPSRSTPSRLALGNGSGVGGPRWRLDLLHCRGGRPGSWTLTWQGGEWHAQASDTPAAADVALAAAAGD